MLTFLFPDCVWCLQAIPLHLLHTEFDLLEGNTEVLLPLLYHIRKVSGPRLRLPYHDQLGA